MSRHKEGINQRKFRKAAIKRLPHHFALSLTSKKYLKVFRSKLNRIGNNFIEDGTVSLKFDKDIVREYQKVTSDTKFWHGTGQFQHANNGKIVSVLKTIIKDRGLKPFLDAYAVFVGGQAMETISLTKSRIIARSYADIHGSAIHEKNRYGNAFFWVSYYYGLFYTKLYLLNMRVLRKNWSKWHTLTHNEADENTWGKKVNTSARDVWDTFIIGSDIPNNFPILIGIKKVDSPVRLSKIFSQYEVRSEAMVKIDDFTHLEVPEKRIVEIRLLLDRQGLNLPVFPIELGELISSKSTISELLNI